MYKIQKFSKKIRKLFKKSWNENVEIEKLTSEFLFLGFFYFFLGILWLFSFQQLFNENHAETWVVNLKLFYF